MNQVLVAGDSLVGEGKCKILHLAGASCGTKVVVRGGTGDGGEP